MAESGWNDARVSAGGRVDIGGLVSVWGKQHERLEDAGKKGSTNPINQGGPQSAFIELIRVCMPFCTIHFVVSPPWVFERQENAAHDAMTITHDGWTAGRTAVSPPS